MLKKLLIVLFLVSSLYIIGFKKNKIYINEVVINENSTYNTDLCKSILEIKKIDLYKCMNINDVDRDISIIFDDKTVVLAGHSGNGYSAYFKDLYKLEINDDVVFYHNGYKNNYKVINIDSKLKKDKLLFNNIDNQLILITCSYVKNNEQLVYYLQKI